MNTFTMALGLLALDRTAEAPVILGRTASTHHGDGYHHGEGLRWRPPLRSGSAGVIRPVPATTASVP